MCNDSCPGSAMGTAAQAAIMRARYRPACYSAERDPADAAAKEVAAVGTVLADDQLWQIKP